MQAVFADFGMCCNTRTTRHIQPLLRNLRYQTIVLDTYIPHNCDAPMFWSFYTLFGIDVYLFTAIGFPPGASNR